MENEEMNAATEIQNEEKKFCIKCGAELIDDQLFCGKCGHKVGDVVKADAGTSDVAPKKGKSMVIGIVIAAVVLILAGVAVFFIIRGKQADSITLNTEELTIKAGENGNLTFVIDPDDTKDKTVVWSTSNESIATVKDGKITAVNEGDCVITITTANGKTDTCKIIVTPAGPDFQAIYDEYCKSSFAKLGSDGSYLELTCTEENYYDAYYMIPEVNEALGLSEAVFNMMVTTRAVDGTQSYETDDVYVTWSYNPNSGLYIMYTAKN